MKQRVRHLLSVLLVCAMVLSFLPISVLAEELETPLTTVTEPAGVPEPEGEGEPGEEPKPEPELTPEPADEPAPAPKIVYVGGTGENHFDSLAAAVTAINNMTETNFVIEVQSDLTATKCARITDKNVTIHGNGYTITRGDEFKTISDNGRSWYNPAIIEVTTPEEQGASLTLENIVLDDAKKYEGTVFAQADKSDNTLKVQDAIVAAYGTGNATAEITLGEGAVLKNFGGMSAVRVTGGATLTMKEGSVICDDTVTDRIKGEAGSNGPAGAVWVQGTNATMMSGAEIRNVIGRAFYIDGGSASIGGTIFNIQGDLDMWQGMNGVAVHVRNKGWAVLESTGVIDTITGKHDGYRGAIVTNGHRPDGGYDFEAKEGSRISNVKGFPTLFSNYGHELLNGLISGCENDYIIGGFAQVTTIGETAQITDCTAKGGAANAIVYTSNASDIHMKGTIRNNQASYAFYIINQTGGGAELWIYDGALIQGKGTATGVYINASSSAAYMEGGTITDFSTGVYCRGKPGGKSAKFIMTDGTIKNNSLYGVNYAATSGSNSLVQLFGGSLFDNGSDYQISVSGGSAKDATENIYIAPGVLQEKPEVYVASSIVTLDSNYKAVSLGSASSEAVTALKNSVAEQHTDWPVAGYSALWIKPEDATQSYHFTITRPSSAKKTSLFAAYLPLTEDGKPAEGAKATLVPVNNEPTIDVTLPALPEGASAYALMFVNNKEYTLRPDDITIYTGGGQGDEEYDGGLPKLTLNDCVDLSSGKLTSLEIDGKEVSEDDLMAELLKLFTVKYTDENGKTITNDEIPGEYTATLSWKGEPTTLKINGNNVNGSFETGMLIIRHTEDKEEAEDGTNTYPLLTSETPENPVTHAEAFANKEYGFLKFHTNGDTNREITEIGGISILDDSLLLEHENDNRQQLMEEKAIERLGAAGVGQTYAFDFHYLDLVDAFNGNAWVSASGGTTVYLPYPDGTDIDTNFTLIHYKDLHREYGISGQANVEEAIKACDLEEVNHENTTYGIKFDVDRSGFSPFALVWKVDAHTITATAGPGGSIDPSGTITVGDGMGMYFTITPDSGYRISDVKVDGVSQGNIKEYNFVDVTADHRIEAYFSKDSSGGGTDTRDDYTLHYVTNGGNHLSSETKSSSWTKDYEDLPIPVRDGYTFEGWYWDLRLTEPVTGDVKVDKTTVTLYAKWSGGSYGPDDTGVSDWLETDEHNAFLSGYPDGSFQADKNMTRAEVAQMFYALLLDKNVTITKSFSDVPTDAWYAKAVNTLSSLGMLGGYPDGTFRPDAPITRAEFAAIALAFAYDPASASCSYTDVSANAWYYTYVAQATTYGWIGGYPDGSFRPNNSITRAEVAVIVNNMLGRDADESYINRNADELVSFVDLSKNHWAYYTIMESTNSHDYTASSNGESLKA